MKRIILLTIIIVTLGSLALGQKLTEPKLLGSLVAGEDPSEFLLHTVMDYLQGLLKENPDGKLIVRICSSDNFSTAFVKAIFSPLAASQYNQYQLLVPYEKIFIAKSSKCSREDKVVFNQYWFVPSETNLEYEEIFPVNSISHKSFVVDEYNSTGERLTEKNIKEKNKEFAENITEFIVELKNNPKTEGFIVYNSKNKRMKHNIEKVYASLKMENINSQRIKTVVRLRLEFNRKEKLILVSNEKAYFPELGVLTIKK